MMDWLYGLEVVFYGFAVAILWLMNGGRGGNLELRREKVIGRRYLEGGIPNVRCMLIQRLDGLESCNLQKLALSAAKEHS